MSSENTLGTLTPQGVPSDLPLVLRQVLQGVFAIEDITTGLSGGKAVRIRGRFTMDTRLAYAQLQPHFAARGQQVLFRRERNGDAILLVDRPPARPQRRWPALLLAAATVVSMLVTHAVPFGDPDFRWELVAQRLPDAGAFTACLLAILVVHEWGHYAVARRFGVAVSVPYLIPFPGSLFGTLGAMILMRDVPPNKRALLLIGAAGPLAGLCVALPVLVVGLLLSSVGPLPSDQPYMMEGNSLLYGLLKWLVYGRWLPSGGQDVLLHPVAWAGWAGLWVTSMNLVPGAQLDGGHIARALLGPRARYLTWGIVALALVLSIGWSGWLLWALLIYLFSRQDAPPADDITPLSRGERLLALGLLLLFLLTLTPLPLRVVDPIGNLRAAGII